MVLTYLSRSRFQTLSESGQHCLPSFPKTWFQCYRLSWNSWSIAIGFLSFWPFWSNEATPEKPIKGGRCVQGMPRFNNLHLPTFEHSTTLIFRCSKSISLPHVSPGVNRCFVRMMYHRVSFALDCPRLYPRCPFA